MAEMSRQRSAERNKSTRKISFLKSVIFGNYERPFFNIDVAARFL